FNVGDNTMYAIVSDNLSPGTYSLATVDTSAHSIAIVGTTSRFATLAFKNGTPNANYLLTVIRDGPGGGVVTSSPSGIDCPATSCEFAFNTGTTVTLTAVADLGARFDGWGGACHGTGPCVTTLNAMRTVRAHFIKFYHLQLQYGGANHGHAAQITIHDADSTQ